MSEPEHFVYIIAAATEAGPVKVGISNDPWHRLSAIQTGSPIPLKLVEIYGCASRRQASDFERQFHQSHSAQRLSGEWFDVSVEDANYWLFRKIDLPDIEAWQERRGATMQ